MATLSTAAKPVGLILAGGQSKRFGSDKALARLIDHQPNLLVMIEKLRPFCGSLVISANTANFFALARLVAPLTDVKVICDAPAYRQRGPLGGLATLLEQITAVDVLMVAVDYPTLPLTALAALAAHPNCYLTSAGKAHYTLAHFNLDRDWWKNWRTTSSSWRLQDFLRARGCSPLTTDVNLVNCNYQRRKIDDDQE